MVYASNAWLFEFFATVELVNIVASIITNTFLVYLILYFSSQEIGVYRYLLFAFAVNDIYFPIVHFFTLPVACSYKDAFLMFSNGILTSRVSICLFACTFSQTMPLLAHLFIYRLIAIKWPTHLSFYTARSCFVVVTVTVVIQSVLWFTHCYVNYGPDPETIEYVQPFLLAEFSGDGQEFIGGTSDEGEFRMRAFFTTMGFNTIMAVWMSVIVLCSYSIVVHLRSSQVQWSDKTKNLQQQLFNTLFVQMLIPMIFVYFPCAGTITLPMLGFRINQFPNLTSASLTIFPLLDAFIIMFGVKSYRIAALYIFKCRKLSITTVTTLTNNQTDAGTTIFTRTN